jgi:hypothetical protein
MNIVTQLKLNKKTFSIGSLDEEPDERQYWHSRAPQERLNAMEIMRQMNYGYDPVTTRLQRFIEIVKKP